MQRYGTVFQVYDSKWYDYPVTMQNMIGSIMKYAQMPDNYMICDMFECSLEKFALVRFQKVGFNLQSIVILINSTDCQLYDCCSDSSEKSRI